MKTLDQRLQQWGQEAHGWTGGYRPSDIASRPVAFRVGPVTGYGRTTNEAVNACADGLVEEGWRDDRADCPFCEGSGDGDSVPGANCYAPCESCGGTSSIDPADAERYRERVAPETRDSLAQAKEDQ